MTESEEQADLPPVLRPWIEPRVEVLDVSDSEIFRGVGHDGSSFPNSTRS